MIRETYTDAYGSEMVIVDNPDGSYWSGLKSTYDAQQEAIANGNNL
jgi:hypothetical protein